MTGIRLPLLFAAMTGGALGAGLRYLIGVLFVQRHWYGIPAATFAVNALGCFLAGGLVVWLDTRLSGQPFLRNLLMVGFLGGLTTFSAFGVEIWQLLRADRFGVAAMTVAAHVIIGVAAVALGWQLGRWLWLRG